MQKNSREMRSKEIAIVLLKNLLRMNEVAAKIQDDPVNTPDYHASLECMCSLSEGEVEEIEEVIKFISENHYGE